MTATAVLLKRVDLRPSVDPLTGDVTPDPHGGMSAADRCALELALLAGDDVLAVTAGPPSSDVVLREALEAGVSSAVRIDLPAAAASAAVGAALARVVAGRSWVFAGDWSLDRGSGSVPAYVAAELGIAQVLGCTAVTVGSSGPDRLDLVRRLDRGRRETVACSAPAVVSVEAGVVEVQRPSLAAVLAARSAQIAVLPGDPGVPLDQGLVAAYRPRARVLDGPDPSLSPRERLVALSGALVDHEPPRVVRAEPGDAADEVLAFLRSKGVWGG